MDKAIESVVSYLSPLAKFLTKDQFVGIATAAARLFAERLFEKANPEESAKSE